MPYLLGYTNARFKLNTIAVLLLVAVSSCSLAKGKGIAEAAVVRFHDQFNGGKFP